MDVAQDRHQIRLNSLDQEIIMDVAQDRHWIRLNSLDQEITMDVAQDLHWIRLNSLDQEITMDVARDPLKLKQTLTNQILLTSDNREQLVYHLRNQK